MNIKNLLCLVSAVSLLASTGASAQSLSELAKAEKQRRAKLQKSGGAAKVYTEADHSGGSSSDTSTTEAAAPAPTTPGAPAAAGAKKKEKTPEEMAADRQKEWNDKVKQAEDQIKELETSITANERNLGSMINITPARADLASRVEADKKKLADLRQSRAALEDERRKAGLPRAR